MMTHAAHAGSFIKELLQERKDSRPKREATITFDTRKTESSNSRLFHYNLELETHNSTYICIYIFKSFKTANV